MSEPPASSAAPAKRPDNIILSFMKCLPKGQFMEREIHDWPGTEVRDRRGNVLPVKTIRNARGKNLTLFQSALNMNYPEPPWRVKRHDGAHTRNVAVLTSIQLY